MIQEAVKWTFEPTHCKIGFSTTHFRISETEGFFKKFNGTISTDTDDFSDAQVDLLIDVNSIDTQDENRDNHLKSADFFNAEQFSNIYFKSLRMEVHKPN